MADHDDTPRLLADAARRIAVAAEAGANDATLDRLIDRAAALSRRGVAQCGSRDELRRRVLDVLEEKAQSSNR